MPAGAEHDAVPPGAGAGVDCCPDDAVAPGAGAGVGCCPNEQLDNPSIATQATIGRSAVRHQIVMAPLSPRRISGAMIRPSAGYSQALYCAGSVLCEFRCSNWISSRPTDHRLPTASSASAVGLKRALRAPRLATRRSCCTRLPARTEQTCRRCSRSWSKPARTAALPVGPAGDDIRPVRASQLPVIRGPRRAAQTGWPMSSLRPRRSPPRRPQTVHQPSPRIHRDTSTPLAAYTRGTVGRIIAAPHRKFDGSREP